VTACTDHGEFWGYTAAISQSKFIFQVTTENYNVTNATALKGLPEKHYAHSDWSPEQKTTQVLIHQNKERDGKRN